MSLKTADVITSLEKDWNIVTVISAITAVTLAYYHFHRSLLLEDKIEAKGGGIGLKSEEGRNRTEYHRPATYW
uniref:Translocon-associated protein subunit gamma n=1 Tax=Elaeophora elaphi TaxID=1147741 RepID=A0A0R3RWP7_9BILA